VRKLLDRVYGASLFLAGLFLVAIFALMIGEAVLRKMGSYITGASELIGWCCAAAGFLALPATFKRGDMVRVGLLVDALPPRVRKPILLACLLLGLVFTGYMLKATAAYMWGSFVVDELTQGMIEIQVWIPMLSFLVGVALMLVAILDEWVVAWRTPPADLRAEKPPAIDEPGL
jgi:TRAP-type C4-dicarboxylate transport system permease small subunit